MMKTLYAYLNERGQGLVEYTLILAFCAVLLTGLRSDEFNYTIKEVFENGVFDDVSTYITAGAYAQAGKAWSQSSRRTLNNIQYSYGRYYLGEDIVDNQKRIDADKEALTNIANFFMGMNLTTLTSKDGVFKGELGENYFKNGTDILLLNFYDEVYGVEDKYDPNTEQYEVSSITTLEKGVRKYDSEEVIHWMKGDYGYADKDDPNSFNRSYSNDSEFVNSDLKGNNYLQSNQRYFYSNQMIDPDGTYSGGTIKRNIRVNIKTNAEGIVTSVTVRAQKNGQDIPELKVNVKK